MHLAHKIREAAVTVEARPVGTELRNSLASDAWDLAVSISRKPVEERNRMLRWILASQHLFPYNVNQYEAAIRENLSRIDSSSPNW